MTELAAQISCAAFLVGDHQGYTRFAIEAEIAPGGARSIYPLPCPRDRAAYISYGTYTGA